MKATAFFPVALLGAFLACSPTLRAEDWPNFRGPNHDGVVRDALASGWKAPPAKLWERKIGSGFSGISRVGDALYTCGTKDGKQTVICLNAADGQVRWQTPIEDSYSERQGGDGPRSTPTVADGRVYVLGALGRLVCLDAASGAEQWSKQFSGKPTWGYSGSVLADQGRVVVSAGGKDGALLALDPSSGSQVWKSGDEPVGYATPYPFTFDGTRYVVGFLGNAILIVQADTGSRAWSMPWKTSYNVNAASPIYQDGYLYLSSGYDHGSVLLKLGRVGDKLAADKVWESRAMRNKFQSAVLYQGHLYASDEAALRCVDFMTGGEKWNVPRIKDSTVVLASDTLLVLTEKGELMVGPASPDGFKPQFTGQLLSGRSWTVPTISGNRMYVRNLETLACFALE